MRVTRRISIVAAAAALIVGGLSVPAQSAAAPDIYALSAIPATLGDFETAGSYLDSNGKVVINVTTAAAAETVRAQGATPRLVSRSAAELNFIVNNLDPRVPGTAWSVDPRTNQVVVDVD